MTAAGRTRWPGFVPLVTDGVTLAFGLWTVVSTTTMLLGATPRHGLNAGAVLLAAVACLIGISYLRGHAWLEAYVADTCQVEPLPVPGIPKPLRVALIVAVPLGIGAWLVTRSPWLAWISTAVFSAACSWASFVQAPPAADETPSVPAALWESCTLHVFALACGLFTLLSFRPRTDDAFYVKMAVTIADYPDLPLLSRDLMHGPATQYLSTQWLFPPYRVHAFESLAGYLSYLTGFEAVAILHLGLATFFGWFAPFAIARVLRLLAPRTWLLALTVTLAYYAIDGTASRGFSNQAFVRLFNGKSVLLTVAVPLLIFYGLRFGSRPSRVRFALLALAQIGAVGFSSTGLWLAPLLAGLAVFAGTRDLRALRVTLPLGVLSTAYVAMLALWVRSHLHVTLDAPIQGVTAAAAAGSPTYGFSLLQWVMPEVLGDERGALALLAVFALACASAQRAVTLRLFGLVGLLASALFANPFLAKWVASSITGRLTYERLFWLLPIPIALGLCAGSIFSWLEPRLRGLGATLVTTGLLCAFFLTATEQLVLGDENHSELRYPPTIKDWPGALETARAVCLLAPAGSTVLAPKPVAHSISLLHHCGHPLIAEMRWMSAPIEEERRRNTLVNAISTNKPISDSQAIVIAGLLDRYRVGVIATSDTAMKNRRLNALLRRAGYRRLNRVSTYHLWHRIDPSEKAQDAAIARSVCRLAGADQLVLAPFSISRAVLAAKCARPPLVEQQQLDEGSLQWLEIDDALSNGRPLPAELESTVRSTLEQLRPRALVVANEALRVSGLKRLMADTGYTRAAAPLGFTILLRAEQAPP